jgi:PPK2 family polyphosphate:nucleotide phosphotransferase
MRYRDAFIVGPEHGVRLSDIDPNFKDRHIDKADADAQIEEDNEKLFSLQYLMFAERKHSLLICLQGLDAAGKDGTIGHVFAALNPQGARVHTFKTPSVEESAHDFLWRAHIPCPEKGEIVIFNRSHYEDVLFARVHGLVPERVWFERYTIINEFERGLSLAGTTILKFYLHVSEDEQLKRFKDRLDDPTRHWKISESDYAERSFFKQYLKAYEEALNKTSTSYAPWFVIPADRKWFRNVVVSKIVVETLNTLGMQFPATTVDIEDIRRKYHAMAKAEKRT